MHAEPTNPQPETLRLSADHLSLRAIGPWLAALSERLGFDQGEVELDAIELAVHEIAMNIVDHAISFGVGECLVTGSCEGDKVIIRTLDYGQPFVSACYTPPTLDEPQVRGYGLLIAEQLAESVHYRQDGEANRWELVFRRVSPGGTSPGQ